MNRIVIASIALVMFVGVVAKAQTPSIVGSKHDFSTTTWAGGEICKPCHIPHVAPNPASISKAFWNHALTNATYTTNTGTGSFAAATGIDTRSRLCLSCHDGTVALDSFGGATGSVIIGTGTMTPNTNLTTDLTNDHPVGYAAVVKDEPRSAGATPSFNTVSSTGKIANPATPTVTLSLITDGTTRTVSGVVKTNYSVGCTTCHSTHPTSYPKLLRVDNTHASALCLTCHIK